MTLGEHVDVGMRHPLAVDLPGSLRKAPVAEGMLLHEETQGLAEGPVALRNHLPVRCLTIPGSGRSVTGALSRATSAGDRRVVSATGAGRAERGAQRAGQAPGPVGSAAPRPWVRAPGPGMPAERAVVLANERLQLPPMFPAGVAVGPVHPTPVPGQPAPGISIDVLAVAEVEELMLERDLRLRVRRAAADFTPKHDRDGHGRHRSA